MDLFYLFFNFILYTHTEIASCCRHKLLKNSMYVTFPESCYAKDYENVKLVNLPSY